MGSSTKHHSDNSMFLILLVFVLVLTGTWLIAWAVSCSKKKKTKTKTVDFSPDMLTALTDSINLAIKEGNRGQIILSVQQLEDVMSKISEKAPIANAGKYTKAVIALAQGLAVLNSQVPESIKPILEKVAQAKPEDKPQLIKQAKESFGLEIADENYDEPQVEGFGGRGGRGGWGRGGRGGWGRGGRGGWGGGGWWGRRRWGRGLGWRYAGMPWGTYYPQCFLRTPGLMCPSFTTPSADGVYCCYSGYNFYA